jgi:aminopeptidase
VCHRIHPAMASSNLVARARQGAQKILSDCLSLRPGDVLTVFYDETTLNPARVIIDEGKTLKLFIRERLVPLSEQRAYSSLSLDGLGLQDAEAIAGARAILTCLSSDVTSMTYRRELIRHATDPGRRLGHMPGITLSLVATAINIDYDQAASRCDDLSLAMSLGQRACLRTYQPGSRERRRREFDLVCDLGGLDRSPLSSTGIIPLGTWGNLPGGETFIAPLEGTASGHFALNGAFRDAVLRRGESLLLHFEDGQLISLEGPAAHKARINKFLQYARERQDEGFNALAELGIGVNSGLSRLTGVPLVDEKCAGTVHIALGENSRYGGRIHSCIHEDLVTRRPSLWIDDKPILRKGDFVFEPEQWRETLASVEPDPETIDQSSLIRRTSLDIETAPGGTLRVRREVVAGRMCTYTIGEKATSRILAPLCALLPPFPQKGGTAELTQRARAELQISSEQVRAALTILLRHGVIEIRRPVSS